jgi:prolyl oligopeptidase
VDPRPTIDAPDDDPYLWLEDIDGAQALAWVDQQNKRTLDRFGHAEFASDRDALAAIYDRSDNIPLTSRHGEHVYNLWRDAESKRGLWRRTTLASYRLATEQPAWELILDLDQLARG